MNTEKKRRHHNPDDPQKLPQKPKGANENDTKTVQGSEVLGSKVTNDKSWLAVFLAQNLEPLNLCLCLGALVAKMFFHRMHRIKSKVRGRV